MLIKVMGKLLITSEVVETCPLCSGSVASYEGRLMMDEELQMRGVLGSPPRALERGKGYVVKDYIAQNPFSDNTFTSTIFLTPDDIALNNVILSVHIVRS